MASNPNSKDRPDISRSGDAAKTHFGTQFNDDLDSAAILAARRRGALHSVDESDYRAANNYLRVDEQHGKLYWVVRITAKAMVFVCGAFFSYGISQLPEEGSARSAAPAVTIMVLTGIFAAVALILEDCRSGLAVRRDK